MLQVKEKCDTTYVRYELNFSGIYWGLGSASLMCGGVAT